MKSIGGGYRCDCGVRDIGDCPAGIDCRAELGAVIPGTSLVPAVTPEPDILDMLPAHSELGASSCYRWWPCPASVLASQGYPDRPSQAARQGTAEHALAEMCLRSGQDAVEYVGRVVEKIEILDDAAERVQEYLDDCRSLISHQFGIEEKFSLAEYDPPLPMYGTVDFWAYWEDDQLLVIRDYKSGWLTVEVAENPQLKYYALGAVITLAKKGLPVSRVRVGINQPRRAGLTEHEYTPMELAAWSVDLLEHARATMAPDAPFLAGEHCRFCKKSGDCLAQAEYNLSTAQLEFSDSEVAVFTGDHAPTGTPPDPATFTPEQIGGILDRREEIEVWFNAVESRARVLEGQGIDVPGWKVVLTRGREAWKNKTDPIDAIKAQGCDPFEPVTLASPAQIRGRIAEMLERIPEWKKSTKKARVEYARKILAPLLHKPPTGEALVADSDSRPALAGGVTEFTLIAGEPENP